MNQSRNSDTTLARRLTRPAVTLLLLAIVATAFTSCTGNDESTANGDNAENSAGGDPDDDSVDKGSSAATPGSQAGFTAQVTDFMTQMEAAGETCEVFSASRAVPLVEPTTPAEAEMAIDALLLQLDKMASTTGETETSNLLRSSAEGLEAYAIEVSYDPASLDLAGAGPDTPAAEDYRNGTQAWMNAAITECSVDAAEQ